MNGKHFIYIMLRPSDGAFKIGCSRRPSVRAHELSSVMRERIKCVYRIGVERDAFRLENTIHKLLAQHRRPGTEWFDVSLIQAIQAIKQGYLGRVVESPRK